ncbi:MAG: hypothetical protein GQE15_28545 [Archangiaceae bacterium]|nr:hypothetical protein [Archangiaceae bacterium]
MISKVGARPVVTSATTTQPKRDAAPQQPVSQTRYPDSFFAAQDVSSQVRRLTELLGDPPVRDSMGARDQWAVIDSTTSAPKKKQDDESLKARTPA